MRPKLFLLILIFVALSPKINAAENWKKLGGIPGGFLRCIAKSDDGTLFVGGNGLFKSKDNGETWQKVPLKYDSTGFIGEIIIDGKRLFVHVVISSGDEFWTYDYLFEETIDSAITRRTDLHDNRAICKNSEGNYYLGDRKYFKLLEHNADSAETISEICHEKIIKPDSPNKCSIVTGYNEIKSILELPNGDILIGTRFGILKSIDKGKTWDSLSMGKTDIISLALSKTGVLFAGAISHGIYTSKDTGITWHNVGPWDNQFHKIVFDRDGNTYALSSSGGLFKTDNDGKDWYELNQKNKTFSDILIDSTNKIFVTTNTNGVLASIDGGRSWIDKNSGLYATEINRLAVNKQGDIFASLSEGGLYRSSDGGATWENIFNDLKDSYEMICSIAFNSKGYVYISINKNIYVSKDNGNTWELALEVKTRYDYNYNIVIDKNDIVYGISVEARVSFGMDYNNRSVFRSSDDGKTWKELLTINYLCDNSFCVSNKGSLFLLQDAYNKKTKSTCKRLYVSNDSGANWKIDSSLNSITSTGDLLAFDKNDNMILTNMGNIYKSADYFATYKKIPYNTFYSTKIIIDDNNQIFLRDYDGKIIRSQDNGETFQTLYESIGKDGFVSDWTIAGDGYQYLATKGGVYKSLVSTK